MYLSSNTPMCTGDL